jgi:hypothetical protein
MSLTFSTGAEHTMVFEFPYTLKKKSSGRAKVGVIHVPRKLFADIHSYNFLPCFGARNSFLKFVQVFQIHPVYISEPYSQRNSNRWSRILISTKSVQPDGSTGTGHDNTKQHSLWRPPIVVVRGEDDHITETHV